MKAFVLSLSFCLALSSAVPRSARADVPAVTWVIAVTPFVIQVALDLQETWNCYFEGFRKRHPSPHPPRPVVPQPDSTPPAPPLTAPAEF